MLLDLWPLFQGAVAPPPEPPPVEAPAGGGPRLKRRRGQGDAEAPIERELFPFERPRRRRRATPAAEQPSEAEVRALIGRLAEGAIPTIEEAEVVMAAPALLPQAPDFARHLTTARHAAATRLIARQAEENEEALLWLLL